MEYRLHTWINKVIGHHTLRKIGLATAVLVASVGAVTAKERNSVRANQFYGTNEVAQNSTPCTSTDDCDRKRFDESGTRGRMGLVSCLANIDYYLSCN
jgi:hypothetical protein